MCPLLLRPPVFLSGSTSARSGSGFVTSAKSETERKRVAEVTGLNCRMPISALEHLDRVAFFQRHDPGVRGLIWASDSSNRSPRRRAYQPSNTWIASPSFSVTIQVFEG